MHLVYVLDAFTSSYRCGGGSVNGFELLLFNLFLGRGSLDQSAILPQNGRANSRSHTGPPGRPSRLLSCLACDIWEPFGCICY
jgi:hypothetical protein